METERTRGRQPLLSWAGVFSTANSAGRSSLSSRGPAWKVSLLRACHPAELAGVVFDTKERDWLTSISWIAGAAEAAGCAVHGSDRRERMDEATPEPWRN